MGHPQQVDLEERSDGNGMCRLNIVLTRWNCLALAAMSFFMQETHEIAHTGVGRLICGGWGRRNFNVWGISTDCPADGFLAVLPTLAGPIYTFAVIWFGYYLMTRASLRAKSWGVALVVSSMPFSRVLTPMLGGGDEVLAMRELGIDRSIAWVVAVLVVFALAVPPVVKIYRLIDNRRKVLWILGLVFAPFFMIGAVVFAVLQGMVLNNGILADYWIMGSPRIVSLWLLAVIVMLLMFGRYASTLLKPCASRAG